MKTSDFVMQQINKRLAELREDCALQRLLLSNAHGRRWSGCPRANPDKPSSWDLYWENLQAQAQIDRPKDVLAADKRLANFIAEHRLLMGSEWIGNDHGRLCWDHYLGGFPIDQHYCQLPEGHEGNHCDKIGAWLPGTHNSHDRLEMEHPMRYIPIPDGHFDTESFGEDFGRRDGPCVVVYRDFTRKGHPQRRSYSCLGCQHLEIGNYDQAYCAHPEFMEKYKCRQSVGDSNRYHHFKKLSSLLCQILSERGREELHRPPEDLLDRDPEYPPRPEEVFQIPQPRR